MLGTFAMETANIISFGAVDLRLGIKFSNGQCCFIYHLSLKNRIITYVNTKSDPGERGETILEQKSYTENIDTKETGEKTHRKPHVGHTI